MTGSPSSIVMLGFGNGTFAGSPSLIVTMGFGIGAAPAVTGTPDHRRRIPGFDESRSRMVLGTDERLRITNSEDTRRRMTDEDVS